MKRLRFINPFSAARAFAVVGGGVTALLEVPTVLFRAVGILAITPQLDTVLPVIIRGVGVIVFVPLFLFLATMICCRFYNGYAEKFGGIEVDCS